MKLMLRSDYSENYDYCFVPEGDLCFHRVSASNAPAQVMRRRELFVLMESFGISTIPHGLIPDLVSQFGEAASYVVYVDEYAHKGEGKVCVPGHIALAQFKDYYASLFMEPAGRGERHFQLGAKSFLMPFYSENDWRCHKGKTFSWCIPGQVEDLFITKVPLPYFAVDYIPGTRLATDFQFCPGTHQDGLDQWLTPRQMYQSLCEAAQALMAAGKLQGGAEFGYGLSYPSGTFA